MQLLIRDTDVNTLGKEVVARHNDQEIVWNITSLDKMFVETKVKFDLFEHINAYWAQLSMPEQDAIFEAYKAIREAFDGYYDRNQLTNLLYDLVARLLDLHDLKGAQHWLMFHANNLIIPDSSVLKTEYVESSDKPGTRDQTYLREDYVRLITLAMVLRSMVPIWGEFIGRTRTETGAVFKEYYAFKLLTRSQLIQSEAMQKLTTYVDRASEAGQNKAASIINGVSSEDFSTWVLGLVVIRKLHVGDIRGQEPAPTTLVTYIYNFIHQKVMTVDSSFNGTAGMIKDKSFDEMSEAGERNLSRLEGYKVKQEIPAGDIVVMEVAASDPYRMASIVMPDIDMDLVTRALKTTEKLYTSRILDPQITLLRWVIRKGMSPQGVLYVNKQTVVRLLAVAQAALWHRGHKELAGLITATAGVDQNDFYGSGVDSRARIPKEMVEEFNTLYPYSKRPTSKQKTQKPINSALASIDHMSEMLSMSDWELTLDDQAMKELTGNSSNRRFAIPHDIKVKLASLSLQLAKRQF